MKRKRINPAFRLLIIINLYLYRFYARWYSSVGGHACLVTTLLLSFNFFEIKFLLFGLPDATAHTGLVVGDTLLSVHQEAYVVALPLLFVLGTINYWLVYHRNKFHDYFLQLSHESEFIIHRDFYIFWLYFLATVVPTGWFIAKSIAAK